MSLRSRQAFVALILVIPILLGGCWSRREIEQLAFVRELLSIMRQNGKVS